MGTRPEIGVATWLGFDRLGDLKVGVAREVMAIGVATWFVLVGRKGGSDMGLMSRPSLVFQEVAT